MRSDFVDWRALSLSHTKPPVRNMQVGLRDAKMMHSDDLYDVLSQESVLIRVHSARTIEYG